MGDNGKMYVPEDILPVYRDVVIPLADILTPNQFEAELITGLKMNDLNGALEVIDALHLKGVKTVVLSSTELGDKRNMLAIASNKGKYTYFYLNFRYVLPCYAYKHNNKRSFFLLIECRDVCHSLIKTRFFYLKFVLENLFDYNYLLIC